MEKFQGTQTVKKRGCVKKGPGGTFTKEGKWVFFFESGRKKSEETFEADKTEGVATWYYENGKKKREYTFKADKMEGPATEWFENGEKKSEAIYKDDNLVTAP